MPGRLEQNVVVSEFVDKVRLESFISTSRLSEFTNTLHRCSQHYMPYANNWIERQLALLWRKVPQAFPYSS